MPDDLMRSYGSRSTRPNGFSLVECLVVVALLGILATLAIPSSGAVKRRLELESGLRRLRLGLDRGRMAAERKSSALCFAAQRQRLAAAVDRRFAGLPWGRDRLV